MMAMVWEGQHCVSLSFVLDVSQMEGFSDCLEVGRLLLGGARKRGYS